MKNFIKQNIRGIMVVPALVMAFAFAVAPAVPAEAAWRGGITNGANAAKGDNTPSNLTDGNDSVFKTVTNVLLFIIGAVAVIMLIYGGIRYTISGGDQNSVKAAKDTILYAIIGIVVAILAYALVNWVINAFTTTSR